RTVQLRREGGIDDLADPAKAVGDVGRHLCTRSCCNGEDSGHRQAEAEPSHVDRHSTSGRRGSFGAYGLHGVGSHFFAPSASFLKCVLVTNSCVRYFGSETTVVTTSHSSPPGVAKRSKYSVIVAASP